MRRRGCRDKGEGGRIVVLLYLVAKSFPNRLPLPCARQENDSEKNCGAERNAVASGGIARYKTEKGDGGGTKKEKGRFLCYQGYGSSSSSPDSSSGSCKNPWSSTQGIGGMQHFLMTWLSISRVMTSMLWFRCIYPLMRLKNRTRRRWRCSRAERVARRLCDSARGERGIDEEDLPLVRTRKEKARKAEENNKYRECGRNCCEQLQVEEVSFVSSDAIELETHIDGQGNAAFPRTA